MSEDELRILKECGRREQSWEPLPFDWRAVRNDRRSAGRATHARDIERKYGPRWSPLLWFGESNPSRQKALRRAIDKLADRGMQVFTESRLTHVRLSEAGWQAIGKKPTRKTRSAAVSQ